MNQIERNKKTDQAWNKLYNRLDKDGLLADANRRCPLYPLVLKWGAAAAIVVFCIYFSFSYFAKDNVVERDLLTQQNNEAGTLVTALEDGSIVYLDGKTSLQYPKHFSSDIREVSLRGNALFDVTGNRARPFIIETREVKIEVLSTAFNVKSNNSVPFELSVQRGKVKVTVKESGQDVYVKAGETVTLFSQGLHLSDITDHGQFNRYTKNMRFKDERLSDILRAINLRGQTIQIQTSPELGKRKLTVSFSDNTPEAMTELICMALNLKYTCEKNTIIIGE